MSYDRQDRHRLLGVNATADSDDAEWMIEAHFVALVWHRRPVEGRTSIDRFALGGVQASVGTRQDEGLSYREDLRTRRETPATVMPFDDTRLGLEHFGDAALDEHP